MKPFILSGNGITVGIEVDRTIKPGEPTWVAKVATIQVGAAGKPYRVIGDSEYAALLDGCKLAAKIMLMHGVVTEEPS